MKQMMKQMNEIEAAPKPQTQIVKIGDEVQEKSGLAPPATAALSDSELIKLFANEKKHKKSKNKK
jgi:hypothetical protein